MIEFSCRGCGKEFQLDDSKAGKRGKCPKCSTIMIVPEKSDNELIFVDDDKFFRDEAVNDLYKNFLAEYEQYIYKHQIVEGEKGNLAQFEVATGKGRSQLVWLMSFDTDAINWVLMYSLVGKIRLMDSAVHALRAVDMFAPYTLSLDDDNYLNLSSMAKTANLDQELFNRSIVRVATKADELEESLFGIDKL